MPNPSLEPTRHAAANFWQLYAFVVIVLPRPAGAVSAGGSARKLKGKRYE